MSIHVTLYRASSVIIEEIEAERFNPWDLFERLPDNAYARAAEEELDFYTIRSLRINGKLVGPLLYTVSAEYRAKIDRDDWLEKYEDPLIWSVIGARSTRYIEREGRPLRYCLLADVGRLVDALEPLQIRQLAPFPSGGELETAKVYGYDLATSDGSVDPLYVNVVENLKGYYNEVLKRGEAVLYHLF